MHRRPGRVAPTGWQTVDCVGAYRYSGGQWDGDDHGVCRVGIRLCGGDGLSNAPDYGGEICHKASLQGRSLRCGDRIMDQVKWDSAGELTGEPPTLTLEIGE